MAASPTLSFGSRMEPAGIASRIHTAGCLWSSSTTSFRPLGRVCCTICGNCSARSLPKRRQSRRGVGGVSAHCLRGQQRERQRSPGKRRRQSRHDMRRDGSGTIEKYRHYRASLRPCRLQPKRCLSRYVCATAFLSATLCADLSALGASCGFCMEAGSMYSTLRCAGTKYFCATR